MVDESGASDISIENFADQCAAVFGNLLSGLDHETFAQSFALCTTNYVSAALEGRRFEAPERRDVAAEDIQGFREATTSFKELAGRMSVDLAVELGHLDQVLAEVAAQAGGHAKAGALDPDRLLKLLSVAALTGDGLTASEFTRAGNCLLVNLDAAYRDLLQWALEHDFHIDGETGTYQGPATRLRKVVDVMREQDGSMAGDIAERMLEGLLELLSRHVGRPGLTLEGRDGLLSLTPALADRALLDQDWISDPDHPLQQFLDTAAQLACASEEENGSSGRLKRLGTMLNGFTRLGDDDVDGISRLTRVQQRFLKSRERREQIAQKRAQEAARAQKRLEESRMTAAGVVDGILKRSSVPPALTAFLREPWNNVIALLCVRHGADSPQAFAAMQTARTLASDGMQAVPVGELLGPLQMVGLHETEAQELVARCIAETKKKPRPKPAVKKAAPASSTEPPTAAPASSPTERKHPAKAKPKPPANKKSASAERPAPDAPPRDKPAPAARQKPPIAAAPHGAGVRIVSLADQIEPGQWVEFRREDGSLLKAKLSWRNPVSKSLLFVDDRGLKVVDRSMAEFARDLRVGDARLLELKANREGTPAV